MTPVASLGPSFLTDAVYVTVCPTTTIPGAAVSVSARSASGVTETVTAALLSRVFGSTVEDDAEALFRSVPASSAVTTNVTFATRPGSSAPSVQCDVTTPRHEPVVAVDEIIEAPAGSVPSSLTAAARLGPAFRIVAVYLSSSPIRTALGVATSCSERSARGATTLQALTRRWRSANRASCRRTNIFRARRSCAS